MKFNQIIVAGVAGLLADTAQANLLNNASFEAEGDHADKAVHWTMNNPDDHGDMWGTAQRTDWRARDGRFICAVRGAWTGLGDFGGVWQEASVESGTTYKASAWFWADGAWGASTQEFKLEFWNAERTLLLDERIVSLSDVGEIWRLKEIEMTAPEGSAWGRVVVNVAGAGYQGALQVDMVTLEPAP